MIQRVNFWIKDPLGYFYKGNKLFYDLKWTKNRVPN